MSSEAPGQSPDPQKVAQTLARLRARLTTPGVEKRKKVDAVRKLVAYHGPEVAGILREALAAAGNEEVLAFIVRGMGFLADASLAGELVPFLGHPSATVVSSAVKSMMALDRHRALHEAATVITGPHQAAAKSVARSLAERYPRYAARLARALVAADDPRRRIGAHLLWRYLPGGVGRPTAVAALCAEHDPAVFGLGLRLMLRSPVVDARTSLAQMRSDLSSKVQAIDRFLAGLDSRFDPSMDASPEKTPAIGMEPLRRAIEALGDAAEASIPPTAVGGQGSPMPSPAEAHGSPPPLAVPATVSPPVPVSETRPAAEPEVSRPVRGRTDRLRPAPAPGPPAARLSRTRALVLFVLLVAACYALSLAGLLQEPDTGPPGHATTPALGECAIGKLGATVTVTGELAEVPRGHNILLVLVRDRGILVSAMYPEPVAHFEKRRSITVSGTIEEIRTPKIVVLRGLTAQQ